ncbi:Transposase-associated domain [Sesbania bispinosa]|nr:Transposase-associated domain [Sesbania bispinosa]
MDKEWTKLPRFSRDYINGVESFLDFAYSKGRPQGEEILCLCAKCGNCCWEKRNVVYNHLVATGFVEGYNVWVHHGERTSRPLEIDKDIEDEEDSRDDIDGLLYDTFRNVVEVEGVNEGGKKIGEPFALDFQSKAQAHRYILFNCEELQVYIREHDDSINSHTKKRKWAKEKVQSQDFSEWFRNRAMKDDVPFQLKELSRGPNVVAKRFSGYLINGYRFHTMKRDARRKTQNSGVTLVSLTPSFASSKDENPKIEPIPYYGAIIDIIELDYYGHFNFVLFRCDWFEVEEDKYGLICVHFNKRCYQDDPFVLASQVHQCFYVQDPLNENRHYVMKTMPRDVFNMSDQLEPRGINAPNDDGEFNWVGEDIPATIIEKPSHVMQEEEFEEESDCDDTLLDFMD